MSSIVNESIIIPAGQIDNVPPEAFGKMRALKSQ